MDYKLELVPLPVSDVDRAKAFYEQQVGFHLDHDLSFGDVRIVQLTPTGSACSVLLSKGVILTPPGSVQALHLVVADITAARDELVGCGVEVSEVQDLGGGVSMAYFGDPDGNTWALQEIAPGAHRPE